MSLRDPGGLTSWLSTEIDAARRDDARAAMAEARAIAARVERGDVWSPAPALEISDDPIVELAHGDPLPGRWPPPDHAGRLLHDLVR